MRRLVGVVMGTVALVGCAVRPPPVPVEGFEPDVAALAGEWMGEYWSAETGRSGSIYFRLEEGADTAVGEVLMIPRGVVHDHPGETHPPSEYIPIAFVRVQGDHVRGVLEPYRDPVCGCRLDTSFSGELSGDTIAGTFKTRHIEGGGIQTGSWRVVRVRP